MGKIMICPKCKKEGIKVITPHNKKGYWLICEDCNYEIQLPNNVITQRMNEVELAYINMLSSIFIKHSFDIEDMQKYKLERFAELQQKTSG